MRILMVGYSDQMQQVDNGQSLVLITAVFTSEVLRAQSDYLHVNWFKTFEP